MRLGPHSSSKPQMAFIDTNNKRIPMLSVSPASRSNAALRGIFRSPSNVFMFGRGGSPNISCTIRFEGSSYETVK